ncbi:PilZ domain-containing protein [Pseudomonas sp. N040]|uniref:PilZ domain-containing protein n=1 Tax=Pseudomonas sp. N040 TaxID=2785325 RepID=UPI0018A28416|nr:PilZ domain-containing protein [Pseudomonas sp. N040]MBF7730255.1 PilZ domain-containing protein [Pseudomonas sp. N040]MBW7013897.1 PilZ domain-containing protein [Pseudomonas sp. N040]
MDNRRQHDRYTLNLQVEAYELHSGERLGRLADLSSEGFMLFCEAPVEADAVLQFRLVPARPVEGIGSVTLEADCLWSREGAHSQHGWAGFQIIDMTGEQATAWGVLLRHLGQP